LDISKRQFDKNPRELAALFKTGIFFSHFNISLIDKWGHTGYIPTS